MRVFERFNVGLTVVHGAIDAEAGSLARLQLNLLATFAELERDMIGERLADARATKKARGERAAGRVPLGYAADPKTKQLVIVESEAAVVRWFFTEAGRVQTAIAARKTRATTTRSKVDERDDPFLLRVGSRQGHVHQRRRHLSR